MRGFLRHCCLVIGVTTSIVALSQTGTDRAKSTGSENASKATIEGLVRDIACPIQNPEATATHLSMKCLRDCVKAGSPLAILTNDGELYVPISDKMPDIDQRKRLLPFAGKYVRASGTVFERTKEKEPTQSP